VECPPGKKAIYDENNKVTILRPWLILLNNFCHDLFTGLWFGSFIVLYVLRDYVKEQGAEMGQPGPWLGEETDADRKTCGSGCFFRRR
jgi:hypothetical protein